MSKDDKIWVLFGELCELQSFVAGTPCRIGNDLLYLRDVVSGGYQQTFKISSGYGTWESASLTTEKNVRGQLEVLGTFEKADTEQLVGILYDILNTKDALEKMRAAGIDAYRVFVRLRH